MSGTQRTLYPVADWLAALASEERRLRRVYLWLEICLMLSGLIAVLIAELWPDLPHHQNPPRFYGYIILLAGGFAILGYHVQAQAKQELHEYKSSSIAHLGRQLLAGEIRGGEIQTTLPKWLSRLARTSTGVTPDAVLSQVTAAAVFYCGKGFTHWIQVATPFVIGVAGCIFAWIMFRGDLADPMWRSKAQVDILIGCYVYMVSFPLLAVMYWRRRTLQRFIPELRHTWEVEQARNADTG